MTPLAGVPIAALALVVFAGPPSARAQEGHDHMDLYSTEDGGGQLVLDWDFDAKKVQTFFTLCTSRCFYSTPNPAFLAPAQNAPEGDRHALREGTEVSLEVIAIDEGLRLIVQGKRFDAEAVANGDRETVLGTVPPPPDELHVHPTWQVAVPPEVFGDYEVSYQVKALPPYEDSIVYTSVVTNQGGNVTPTPSPTPTHRPLPCVGDCDDDKVVSVSELIVGVGMALGEEHLDRCPAFDFNPDDRVMIDELLLSVAASNEGCGTQATPTPTATPGQATLAEIQDTIFTPRCAVVSCHGGAFPTGGLSLEEGESYGGLVDQEPQNGAAAALGLRLVDPGNPDNSFLVIKVEGPDSLALGTRMPQLPPNLTPAQIQLIRDWIAAGAPE